MVRVPGIALAGAVLALSGFAAAQSTGTESTDSSAVPSSPRPADGATLPTDATTRPRAPVALSPITEATFPLGLRYGSAQAPESDVSRRLRLRGARRPYALTIPIDLSLLVAGASLWVPLEFMLPEVVRLGRCPCDPAQLNALDRPVAGLSVQGPVGPISNGLTAAFLALPAVIDMFDVWRSGGTVHEWIEDTVVIGEALVIGGAINEMTKILVQRPRPGAYGIDPASVHLTEADLYLSFYSLSGAEVFTAAMAGAVTYALRHPHSPWRWVYLGGAMTVASGFGLSRVLVGRHFPTDVLVAAAVGSAIGVIVPWLHQRPMPISIGAAAAPGMAVLTATLTTP